MYAQQSNDRRARCALRSLHNPLPALIILAVMALSLPPASVGAQSSSTDWSYSVYGGPSHYVVFAGEPQQAHFSGKSLRPTLRLADYGLGVELARWTRGSDQTKWIAQIVGDATLFADKPVSAHLFSTFGRSAHMGPLVPSDGGGSLTTSYGVGLSINVFRPIVIRSNGVIRLDRSTWHRGYDLLLGWDPGAPARHSRSIRVSGGAALMATLQGPWRPVEPLYSIGLSQSVNERFGLEYSLTLFHWQIPSDQHLGGYIWDTRGFISGYAVTWQAGRSVSVSAGPAIMIMGEGPDRGINLGTLTSIGWSVPVVPLTIHVGLTWVSRPASASPWIGGDDIIAGTLGVRLRP